MISVDRLSAIEQDWTIPGPVHSFEQIEHGIMFNCGGPLLNISVCTFSLVHVQLAPTGQFYPRRSRAVTKDETEWQRTSFTIHEHEQSIELETKASRIEQQRDSARITCFD